MHGSAPAVAQPQDSDTSENSADDDPEKVELRQRPKQKAPDGWSIEFDEKRNEYYFWHEKTETSTWTHPVTGLFADGSEVAVSQPGDSSYPGSSADEDSR